MLFGGCGTGFEIKGDDRRTEVAYLSSNVKQNGELIMKLRDKILYMSFGAMLVVLGMVLNSLVSGDADAQVGGEDAEFGYITCKGLIIKTGDKVRGYFGLDTDGDAIDLLHKSKK